MFDPRLASSITIHEFTPPDGMNMVFALLKPKGLVQATAVTYLGMDGYADRFIELCNGFLRRNCMVIVPELPEQGHSYRFGEKEETKRRNHVEDFGQLVSAAHRFHREVVEDLQDGPIITYGFSLGGHVVTRLMAEYQPKVDACILVAPMFEFTVPPPVKTIVKKITKNLKKNWGAEQEIYQPQQRVKVPLYASAVGRLAVTLGYGESYALGQTDYNPAKQVFEGNALTNNREYFERKKQDLAADPLKANGGPTWAWLVAARKSVQRIKQRGYLDQIDAPVLVISGGKDVITPTKLIAPLAKRMGAEFRIIDEALHDIPGEPIDIRREQWAYIDPFLKRHVFH